jgi:hypothetical protein
MARSTLIFTAETTKQFATNYKRGPEYTATIQNLTNQTVVITVTNQRIQGASPVFDTPAGGAVSIAAGVIGTMTAPYNGWLLTAGSSATGTVEIVEAG